jgi:hypothetical protein
MKSGEKREEEVHVKEQEKLASNDDSREEKKMLRKKRSRGTKSNECTRNANVYAEEVS